MSKTDKSVWISGEVCDVSAIYFSDTCGHPIKKDYRKLDVFTRCPICHEALRWTRAGAAPADTTGPDHPHEYV
ncbi:MAG TPA: hypothetical protein VN625_00740 [Desulfuromonadaceae bacterium]|nr:hypothetical protein [Desulfuromonadaceae bacterium]